MVSTSNKSTKKRMPKHPHTHNLPLWGSANINRFVKLTVRRMFSLLHYSGILTQELPLVKREFPIFFGLFSNFLLQTDRHRLDFKEIPQSQFNIFCRAAAGAAGAPFISVMSDIQHQRPTAIRASAAPHRPSGNRCAKHIYHKRCCAKPVSIEKKSQTKEYRQPKPCQQ